MSWLNFKLDFQKHCSLPSTTFGGLLQLRNNSCNPQIKYYLLCLYIAREINFKLEIYRKRKFEIGTFLVDS